jgi:hypothetical protein
MFVLINCSNDGDTYAIFNEIENARIAFEDSCKDDSNHHVYIVKPNEFGETFGFGSWGDIFGAEVIAEFIVDE